MYVYSMQNPHHSQPKGHHIYENNFKLFHSGVNDANYLFSVRTYSLVHYIAPQSNQHRQVGNTFNVTDGNPNLNNASSPIL